MKYGTILFLVALSIGGCTSEVPPAQVKSNSITNTPDSVNHKQGVNPAVSPIHASNSDAAVSNAAAESPLETSRNKRLDVVRKAGTDPNAPKLDIEAVLKQSTRPAPEDSQFSVALADILVERRAFMSHPVLARAEKVTNGEKKTLHVFTRDGKSFEAPGDLVPSLSTATSSAILKAVGIDPPKSSPAARKPKAEPQN